MKKKLLQAIGLFSAMMLLAGCNGVATNNGTPTTPASETVSGETTGGENAGEITESGESENLTAGRTPAQIESAEIQDEQVACLSEASVSLLYEIMNREGDKSRNILISPMSIQTALGMTELGAEGKTLEQMEKYVNGGLSQEELRLVMENLSSHMRSSGDVNWNVANSLWFRDNQKARLKEDFLNDVVTYYHSDVFYAPFNHQTLNDINGWVNTETHEMIPEILDEIPDDAYMYLINAIAFEAEWKDPYEEGQVREDRTFENINGSESKVTMLSSTENRYFTLQGGEGFIKPYQGGEYSFVGILPKEGQTPEEYLKKLSGSNTDFAKAVREADYEEVKVWLPEFNMDYDIELSDTYKALGMDVPFDQDNAQFHKMMEPVNNDPYQVWIGRILHKTHIEVDRKGTKAAAVTAVEMDLAMSAMPMDEKEIYLDRPFVYAIVDNATGYPIFLGAQNSME